MKTFFLNLLNWIYKKKCYFCGKSKENQKMCSHCYNQMNYLPLEASRNLMGVNIYCAGTYEQNLQKMIRGLKYHNQKDLAFFQAKFMYDYWLKLPNKEEQYTVIPVPLYKSREKSRKYNHMKLVVDEFCNLSGYEINLDFLKRIKDTKPQYRLSKNQRMENLANAFEINPQFKPEYPVIILDDICTTGATFENIIIELKKSNINNIVCFATTTPIVEL